MDDTSTSGPLRLTTARWLNRRRPTRDHDGQPSERWSKVLAHKGSYDQFGYGTDTPSNWQGPVQRAVICSPWSGVIAVDVDDEASYLTTRTAQHVRREDAWSTRGGGFHALIDARNVPPDQWPGQGPIAGADIKSKGFVPLPDSMHYSGARYEPVFRPDGRATVITATPELIAAIHADQGAAADQRRSSGLAGATAGTGGGHDGEVAAETMSIVLRLLRLGLVPGDEMKEAAYAQWLKIAVPHDPGDPFTRADFLRHYEGTDGQSGGLAEALKVIAADVPVTADMMRWATEVTQVTSTQPDAGQPTTDGAHDALPDTGGLAGQDAPLKSDADLADEAAANALGDFRWAGGLGWVRYDEALGTWDSVPEELVSDAVKGYVQYKRVQCLQDEVRAVTGGQDGKIFAEMASAWAARASASRIFAVTRLARGICYQDPATFDSHRDLVNCPNGVLDLKTLALGEHRPGLLFTKCAGAAYVPSARHPDIDQALESVPAEIRGYAQLRYGQALTGHTPPDDGVCVHYGSGSNGKGAVMAAVMAASGGYAALLPPPLLLADPRAHTTDFMTLRGVRIGFVDELPEESQLSVQRMKILSQPQITARHIRQDNVTFKNECSVFINTNYRPQVRETDHGTWRRLGVSWPFPYTFRQPHEPLANLNDRAGDGTLRQRVETDADGSRARAMLAWMAEGARRFYAGEPGRPGQTLGEPPVMVRASVAEWRESCDLLFAFITDHLVWDTGSHIAASDLLMMFNPWVKSRGHREWSAETLAARFAAHHEVVTHSVTKSKVRKSVAVSRPVGWEPDTLTAQYAAWTGVRWLQADENPQLGTGGTTTSETLIREPKLQVLETGRPTRPTPVLSYDWAALYAMADHRAA